MKRLKIFAIIALGIAFTLLIAGCYMVSGQTMSKVQGTYELTSYSRTNGKNNSVTDYVADGYKAYLIVTGTSEGYYVIDDGETQPYYRMATLSYLYNAEDSSKVEYVIYRLEGSAEEQKLGVIKDGLNFSRPVVKFSENVYSDGLSMTFKKVSKKTDLTYAQEKLGTLAQYAFPSN